MKRALKRNWECGDTTSLPSANNPFFQKKLAYIPTGMIGSSAILDGEKKAAVC
jgi:hypothetical protein